MPISPYDSYSGLWMITYITEKTITFAAFVGERLKFKQETVKFFEDGIRNGKRAIVQPNIAKLMHKGW